MSDSFYIIDVDRTRVSESVVFWRADRHGYTCDVNDAGQYVRAEAVKITDNPDKSNVMVPVARIDRSRLVTIMVKSHLVDVLAAAKDPDRPSASELEVQTCLPVEVRR